MRKLKNRILALICLLMVTSNYAIISAFTDNYPKNPKIDAINYAFNIELSDETDEITCDVTIDVRFLGAGVKNLRLDLVNASEELNNKGMVVSRVSSNGRALSYSHIDYVIEVFEQIKKEKKKARGIKIVKEPKYLRHFTSHFKFV